MILLTEELLAVLVLLVLNNLRCSSLISHMLLRYQIFQLSNKVVFVREVSIVLDEVLLLRLEWYLLYLCTALYKKILRGLELFVEHVVCCSIDCNRVFFVFTLHLTVNIQIVLVRNIVFLWGQPLSLVIIFKYFLSVHRNRDLWHLLLLFVRF